MTELAEIILPECANLIQDIPITTLKDAGGPDELSLKNAELNDINRELVLSNIHVSGAY